MDVRAAVLHDARTPLRVETLTLDPPHAGEVLVRVAGAVPIPPELPLWQAALLGCAVVTGFGAVRNAARVAIGETVCVVGCGGGRPPNVPPARLARAGPLLALGP